MWIRIGGNPGSGIFLTLDPRSGTEIIDSGIRDKHPGSATLVTYKRNIYLVKRILLFLRNNKIFLHSHPKRGYREHSTAKVSGTAMQRQKQWT
jgi:hypothetical protein